jgi:hypothetical protein
MPNLKTITQNLAVEDVRSIIDSIGQENPENLIDAPEFLLCLCSSLLRKPDV